MAQTRAGIAFPAIAVPLIKLFKNYQKILTVLLMRSLRLTSAVYAPLMERFVCVGLIPLPSWNA